MHIARQPSVTGGRDVLGSHPVPDCRGGCGVHGPEQAFGRRCVVRPDAVGYGWFRDMLPAQIARAGIDCRGRQDGGLDEHELGAVEPAAVVAAIEAGGFCPGAGARPETSRDSRLPVASTPEPAQLPSMPRLGENRLVDTGRLSRAAAVGAPISAISSIPSVLSHCCYE